MGFAADQLRDKALLALEEAVQECRYRSPRRSFALRFAVAYLWASSQGERWPFDEFWKALCAPKSPGSFSAADRALRGIYGALDVERDENLCFELWRRRQEEERQHEQGSQV